jgi:hypothetical protein
MTQQTYHIGDINKTMTAVEWLIKRYHDYGTLYYEDMTQAKSMEKEQIKEAYLLGVKMGEEFEDNCPECEGEGCAECGITIED